MLDPLFVALTVVGTGGALWLAVAAALSLGRRTPAPLALVAAGVVAADLLALVLKMAGGRDRPFVVHPDPEPLVGTALDLSFPSGHSATAFAGATILAALAPRLAPALYAVAALVAVSRVYVGVHYPLDVLAGMLLGIGVGLLVVLLARRLPAAAVRAPRSPGAGPRRSRRPRTRG